MKRRESDNVVKEYCYMIGYNKKANFWLIEILTHFATIAWHFARFIVVGRAFVWKLTPKHLVLDPLCFLRYSHHVSRNVFEVILHIDIPIRLFLI